MKYYYFCGVAYQTIKDDDFGELEYDEWFEKIIEAKNKKEAKIKLEKELSELMRLLYTLRS